MGPTTAEASLGFDTRASSSAYNRYVADGVAEHSVGHWAEARALFRRAHELEPSARTLRVLGMTAFELREYPDAVRELSAALSARRHPLSPAQRRQVSELLERADTFVGRFQLELEPPHARVESGGMELVRESDGSVLLPLGRQLLSIQAVGYRPSQRTIMVDGSDGAKLQFGLEPLWWAWDTLAPPQIEPAFPGSSLATPWPPPTTPTSQSWNFRAYAWTWISAGTAVGLAGTSLALRRRAIHEDDTRPRDCGSECDPWSPRTRDRLNQWSAITLGASLAFVASAVTIYFAEARAARSAK